MTTKKSKELVTTDTTIDPRDRMREIRSIVSKAVREKGRIDQMKFNKEDNARVIIALQDLLEQSQSRHKKASDHVLDLKNQNIHFRKMGSFTSKLSLVAINAHLSKQEKLNKEKKILVENLRTAHDEINSLRGELHTANNDVADFEYKLSAALTTIKTVME